MDNIKVNLLHYTPIDIALKAISKPYRNEKPTTDLLRRIVNFGHESTIEHISFNFEIIGISRLCLQEIVRHRIASYTVESTRYTLHKMLKEFEPFLFSNGNIKQLSVDIDANKTEILGLINKYFVNPYNIIESETCYYSDIALMDLYYSNMFSQIESLFNSYYFVKEMLNIRRIEERPEDFLKYNLLESKRTELVMTINLRSMRNFLRLRDSKKAHFEIRKVAELMKEEILKTEFAFLLESK